MSAAHDFDYSDRLPFRLQDFTRVGWVSEAARDAWTPRLARIAVAWEDVEWRSVIHGVRRAALLILPEHVAVARAQKWLKHELDVLPIHLLSGGRVRVAVGRRPDIEELKSAWLEGDHDAVGAMLGYPPCCRNFFQEVWQSLQCTDTTWAMALNSPAQRSGNSIELTGAHAVNILWRWLGVRLVPHLPCSFACTASGENAAHIRSVGEQCGYADEFACIEEILSWPVEWSALHGVAEVRTPVLKVSTQTDATANKYVVRYSGTRYPREGAQGLHFPWRSPSKRAGAATASFRRGIANPIPVFAAQPDWHHRENGFRTRHAMERMHAPIVAAARERLSAAPGKIIDLGCGNGTLLSKICHGATGLTPFGVERNLSALEHARVLHPAFSANFVNGDFLRDSDWTTHRYHLAILMVGRLLELPATQRSDIAAKLRSCCEDILLYLYPGYSSEDVDTLARHVGLDVAGKVCGAAGVQIVCGKLL